MFHDKKNAMVASFQHRQNGDSYIVPEWHFHLDFCHFTLFQASQYIVFIVLHCEPHLVRLQVLRDLGISETRLQNGLVEVWNKTDLLSSEPTPEAPAQLSASSEPVVSSSSGAHITLH